jgi:molecular chaperone GrpE
MLRWKNRQPVKGPKVNPSEEPRGADPSAPAEDPDRSLAGAGDADAFDSGSEAKEPETGDAAAAPGISPDARILSPEEMTYLEQFQRLQAEFANFRRRIQRERADWENRAKGEVLTGLLPILDDIDRARTFWQSHAADNHAEGFLLILTRLEDFARSVGLEMQQTDVGTPFDPHQHEALLSSPSEEAPEGAILETLQPGYCYRGILLRPARVRVSMGPSGESA